MLEEIEHYFFNILKNENPKIAKYMEHLDKSFKSQSLKGWDERGTYG